MEACSRRSFLRGAGMTAAAFAASSSLGMAKTPKSPFKIAVINDEISQDFDHVCYVISHDFGLSWIELRSMWDKNTMDLSDVQIAEAQKILAKYNLRVTDIASPLFKTDWPDAPRSKFSTTGDMHGASISLSSSRTKFLNAPSPEPNSSTLTRFAASTFGASTTLRPIARPSMRNCAPLLRSAGKQDILLVLENEMACNTATGREAARTLSAVPSPHFALNWDPCNAVMRGELDAFPTAWKLLPKDRIHHCHVKNAAKNADGKVELSPVDKGIIDWTAQFRALKQAGFHDAVSLETHWHGGGTPEQSSRISWAGMKQALKDSGTL